MYYNTPLQSIPFHNNSTSEFYNSIIHNSWY